MSKHSFQAVLADWERLLRALKATPYEIPGIGSFRNELEVAFSKARALKIQQVALQIASQQATQQVNEAVAHGRDAASRLRSFLKGRLGPHNEDLVRFGVAPIRKRRPRRALLPPTAAPQVN